jgi:acetyl esterase/lipase
MKLTLILAATLLLGALAVPHASAQAPTQPFPLWPQGAPGSLGKEDKDVPTLTPFFASSDRATGAVMVVLPGGGYGGLAAHEGRDYALWLNEIGVTAFVLKYRLGSGGYRHPIMVNDAARAVRYVRSKAAEWKLDAKRVGIMGSSAGGHLASTLLTHFDAGDANAADPIDRLSSRPDLGILCYPVITLGEKTHQGSKNNLLGPSPTPELVQLLSNELQVTKDTPTTFLFHTAEDTAVPVENSLLFAASLAKNKVPFSLHVYPKGAHGIGLGTRNWDPAARHPWVNECALWLKEQNFVR